MVLSRDTANEAAKVRAPRSLVCLCLSHDLLQTAFNQVAEASTKLIRYTTATAATLRAISRPTIGEPCATATTLVMLKPEGVVSWCPSSVLADDLQAWIQSNSHVLVPELTTAVAAELASFGKPLVIALIAAEHVNDDRCALLSCSLFVLAA